MGTEADEEQEARRLKTIAETKFSNSNLKSALKHAKKAHRISPKLDGLSSMLTALKILRIACKTQNSDITDWYKILQVEPFSHMNAIKKQYKKLALGLHPDKNPFIGCEEAFKLVADGFRVLSDKIRRKEYDLRLRIRLQEERVSDNSAVDTFWTACSRCRLLHQFERQYLGHNLVCPSCKKSFEAVEVKGGDEKDAGVGVWNERLRRKDVGVEGIGGLGSGQNNGSVGQKGKVINVDLKGKMVSAGLRREVDTESAGGVNLNGNEVISGEWGCGKLRTGGLRRKMSTVDEVLERSKLKRVKFADEMMTLAEMKLEAKKKASQKKVELKEKQKGVGKKEKKEKQKEKAKEKEKEKEKEICLFLNKSMDLETEKNGSSKKSGDLEIETREAVNTSRKMEIMRQGASRKSASLQIGRHKNSRGNLDSMAVKDSNFFDFDGDRVERSFKKGQVWATYDDDDGMPRHYGLIDEVVSVNPFKLSLRWLDLQRHGNEILVWDKMGLHVSCGRFKVARTMTIDSVNIFSHAVECEREAREVYRIYPKKGSVWALYNEASFGAEGRNLSDSDRRCYDIVVLLTTYSEMHGLSMAYLEKVDGYKTVFKRREIGCHAVRLLEKDDIQLFSHQIPSRKFSGDEAADNLKDCWELDPASLPSDLLTIGGEDDIE